MKVERVMGIEPKQKQHGDRRKISLIG